MSRLVFAEAKKRDAAGVSPWGFTFNSMENSLGALIRQAREVAGLGISDLAYELQISVGFVKAFEEDDYRVFSARVYARGFLQKILDRLPSVNREEALAMFEIVWVRNLGDMPSGRDGAKTSFAPFKRISNGFTTRRMGLVGGGATFLFLFIFLGWRMSKLLLPPPLDLWEPKDRIILNGSKVRIIGFTLKESRLTMNSREIGLDDKGGFDKEVELVKGLNTLEFYAESRFGKINKLTRYVVVKFIP